MSINECILLYTPKSNTNIIGQGIIDLINEADCCYAIASGDYKSLADVIVNKVLIDVDGFKEKGRSMYANEFM